MLKSVLDQQPQVPFPYWMNAPDFVVSKILGVDKRDRTPEGWEEAQKP